MSNNSYHCSYLLCSRHYHLHYSSQNFNIFNFHAILFLGSRIQSEELYLFFLLCVLLNVLFNLVLERSNFLDEEGGFFKLFQNYLK